MASAARAAVADLADVARGWRWGRRPLVPRTAEEHSQPVDAGGYATSWARSLPVRVLREVVQVGALSPLLRREVSLDVHGTQELRDLVGPVLVVANHSSHLDTPVLLATLPRPRRRSTAVAAVADYFFDARWRAGASAVAFNTLPIEQADGTLAATPAELLRAGWSIIVYPEGTRSADGFVGSFLSAAARLALAEQVPVVPVGLRGTYAAMPRGRGWPAPGRPRVSVRYGTAVRPGAAETADQLTERIETAVRQLVAEDAGSWWAVQRGAWTPEDEPPPAGWRRIWAQAEEPAAGGVTKPAQIWRS